MSADEFEAWLAMIVRMVAGLLGVGIIVSQIFFTSVHLPLLILGIGLCGPNITAALSALSGGEFSVGFAPRGAPTQAARFGDKQAEVDALVAAHIADPDSFVEDLDLQLDYALGLKECPEAEKVRYRNARLQTISKTLRDLKNKIPQRP